MSHMENVQFLLTSIVQSKNLILIKVIMTHEEYTSYKERNNDI